MNERHEEIASTMPAELDALPRLGGFRLRGIEMTRLETFIDAAFAFAITMLVIAAQQIPDDIKTLLAAFKNVPVFITSIIVLGIFWRGHWLCSRRYGLEDGVSILISWAMIVTILIYMYPPKAIFSSIVVFAQQRSSRPHPRSSFRIATALSFCDLRARVYRHRTGSGAVVSACLAVAEAVTIGCTGKIDHAL